MNSGKQIHSSKKMSFEELSKKYNPLPILKLIGFLQLLPENHGHNVSFEMMARELVRQINDSVTKPYAPWTELTQAIRSYTGAVGLNGPPENLYTENVVFREGDYTVYPGLTTDGARILNDLLECIFTRENQLPEGFKKYIGSAAELLLLFSNISASELDHKRYALKESKDSIEFPAYDHFIGNSRAIIYTKELIAELCQRNGLDSSVLDEFIINPNDPKLADSDPMTNIVLTKPLLADGDSIMMYMPTTVVTSLIQFIYRKAKSLECYPALLEAFHKEQFHKVLLCAEQMNWAPLGITPPKNTTGLKAMERLFQIDKDKFAYLCYVHDDRSGHDLTSLMEQHFAHLKEKLPEYLKKLDTRFLAVFVVAEDANELLKIYPQPKCADHAILFQYNEFDKIAYSKETEILSLWKFAKCVDYTGDKLTIMSTGGMLDLYAIYQMNNGSLLNSDEANPIGGMLMFIPGSSIDFSRAVKAYRDEHAMFVMTGHGAGYTQVVRARSFAPIYKLRDDSIEFRIGLDCYSTPIWVSNNQSTAEATDNWSHSICEAVCFWLYQMRDELNEVMAKVKFIQFEIELVLDQDLLEKDEYIKQSVDLNLIEIKRNVAPPKIQLHIPYYFMYLVMLPDNRADRLLMEAVLKGLLEYTTGAGHPLILTNERIPEIVASVLQNERAKMMIMADSRHNVRLDNRNLPPLRYLQETDISLVLDNLVSYLPSDLTIPEEVTDKPEKIKLCDLVVAGLLNILQERIAEFDGKDLLTWLVKLNERLTQKREFREIQLPAKIACFGDFELEVSQFHEQDEKMVPTAHAIRTLIEFVASKPPLGKKPANFDDLDELLAMCSQIASWGSVSEAMRMGVDEPQMGLLPSGRVGTNKDFQKEKLEPYAQARSSAQIFGYVEKFESHYVKGFSEDDTELGPDDGLDEAFFAEYGIVLNDLLQITGMMINLGFEAVKPCFEITEMDLEVKLSELLPEIPAETLSLVLQFLSLLERPGLGLPPQGYSVKDIFPWRYSRAISYMRKPLIKLKTDNRKHMYLFGYRHLLAYIDNLFYLLYSGKLPEENSDKMKSWIGKILKEKGTPYRNDVMNWFKTFGHLQVIEHEVKMNFGGKKNEEENLGDVDVMVIDNEKKLIYSIECKNGVGARNIHEMKVEMDLYLGREGKEKKAKINKHVTRHKWLSANPEFLEQFVQDSESYQVISFVLTAEEMPLSYLGGERIPLPLFSFPKLKMKGLSMLPTKP
jgi:hypothetical protein